MFISKFIFLSSVLILLLESGHGSFIKWIEELSLLFHCFWITYVYNGLPWWLSGKEPSYQSSRCRFDPWVEKIPWRRNWQPISVFLPGKSHGQRSLVGCNRWACKRVVHKLSDQMPATDTHNRFICALETSWNLPGSCLGLYFCQCVLVIFISLFKCNCLKYWFFQAFYLCQFLSKYLFDLNFQFFSLNS